MDAQVEATGTDEVREHYAWIKRVARGLVRDPNVAGDLAQEAWLVALQSPPAANVDFRSWLKGVLRNKAKHLWRGDRRRADHEAQAHEQPPAGSQPDELLASSEASQVLIEELQALAEPFRSTLLLSAMKNLSSVAIARQEGIPEGTVRWRLKRGRELLAERLDLRYGSRRDWMSGFSALLLPRVGTSASVPFAPLLLAAILAAVLLGPALSLWSHSSPVKRSGAQAILPDSRLAQTGPALDLGTLEGQQATPPKALGREPGEEREAIPDRQASRAQPIFLDAGQAEVRIRLVNPEGSPLQGVRFELPGDRGQFARTAVDGRAALRFRPSADAVRVHLYAGSERPSSSREVAGQILPTYVRTGVVTELGDVIMHGTTRASGRVVDATGRGIGGASLFLGEPGQDHSRRELLESGPPLWVAYMENVANTAEDGSFEIWVPKCTFQLWAGSPGTLYGTLDGPGSAEPIELRLDPLDDSRAVRGRVNAPSGEPLQGIEVRGTSVGRNMNLLRTKALPDSIRWRFAPATVLTDESGNFVLPTRGPHAIQLRIRDPEDRWEDEQLEVLPGMADLNLRFERDL